MDDMTNKGVDVLKEILAGNVRVQEQSEVERDANEVFRKITGVDYEIVRLKYDADAGVMLNQMLTDLQQVLGGGICVLAALNRTLVSEEVKALFKDEPNALALERAKVMGITRAYTQVYTDAMKALFN